MSQRTKNSSSKRKLRKSKIDNYCFLYSSSDDEEAIPRKKVSKANSSRTRNDPERRNCKMSCNERLTISYSISESESSNDHHEVHTSTVDLRGEVNDQSELNSSLALITDVDKIFDGMESSDRNMQGEQNDSVVIVNESNMPASRKRNRKLRINKEPDEIIDLCNSPVKKGAEPEVPGKTVTIPECPICLQTFQESRAWSTMCGHVFCERCLKATISAKKKCPICRRNINLKNIHPLHLNL